MRIIFFFFAILRALHALEHRFGDFIMIKYENPSPDYETQVRVCEFYGNRVPVLKDLTMFFAAVATFGIRNHWLVKHHVIISAPSDYLYAQFKRIGSYNAVVVNLSKEYIGSSLFLCVRKVVTNETVVVAPRAERKMITLLYVCLLLLCTANVLHLCSFCLHSLQKRRRGKRTENATY